MIWLWTRMTAACVGLAVVALVNGAAAQTVAEIHQRALVLDRHVDVAAPGADDQAALSKLRAGGVDAVVLTVFASTARDAQGQARARGEAESRLAAIKQFARDHPQDVAIADDAANSRAIASGCLATITTFIG